VTQSEKPALCPSLDPDGFLIDPQSRDEALACRIAHQDGVELADAHWRVLHFLRGYYEEHQGVPRMREVLQGTGLTSSELYRLFPGGGPLMQGARIAGLPKPTGCVS
jgi:tRNA 2-thiouridine synthesizing protein E